MTTYMHCRPCCGTNISICPVTFLFVRPDYITTSNYQSSIPPSHQYDDQIPSPPPSVTPRRRRRLEDPITTHASNYYATFPRQMSQASPPPPLPPRRRICKQSDHNVRYCDLYNLLEYPSAPSPPIVKHKRKVHFNDLNRRRPHPSTDSENVHLKRKNENERALHSHRSCYYKGKKRQDDKLSSIEQYDQTAEKAKQRNDMYQRHSSNKGFFRRVVRNYFCMPSMFTNNGYSS